MASMERSAVCYEVKAVAQLERLALPCRWGAGEGGRTSGIIWTGAVLRMMAVQMYRQSPRLNALRLHGPGAHVEGCHAHAVEDC